VQTIAECALKRRGGTAAVISFVLNTQPRADLRAARASCLPSIQRPVRSYSSQAIPPRRARDRTIQSTA
jgi:hypothetical protein